MGRKIAFVPTAAPGVPALVNIDDIPQNVKDEVEEIYAALKANPNGRMRAEFDNTAELRVYVAQVTSYCEQRPAGAIRFRKSPIKKLPDHIMEFRITDLKTPNEEITEDIRTATAAVNAPAPTVAKKATSAKK